MGIYVDDADELAEAITKLSYRELMGIGADMSRLLSEKANTPVQPHEWAQLFYEWAAVRAAIVKEEREKRRAEEEAKKQAAAARPVNLQKGVAR